MDDYIMSMPRYTLLDKVLEGVQLSSRKGTSSRVMFAAKCVNKEMSKQHQMTYQSELLQRASGSVALEKISGCLLVYPTCVLHMVEAESQVLMALLRALSLPDAAFELDAVCVLSLSEDIPYRAFPAWFCAYVSATNLGPYEGLPADAVTGAATRLNLGMLKWGAMLSAMNKENQVLAIDSLKATAGELLPDDPAAIQGLLLSPPTSLPSLSDFLRLCLDQHDAIFDSQLVWPIQPIHPFWRNLIVQPPPPPAPPSAAASSPLSPPGAASSPSPPPPH